MVGDCYDKLPNEACGLLAGKGDNATECHAITNAANSSRIYALDGKEYLRVDRKVEDAGLALIAVYHSHTHTVAYPSPTDVEQAVDPSWHYVLVSMADEVPSVRSYRIIDGKITEESVVVVY